MAEYNVKAILTANATQLIAGMREAKASVEQFGQATTHIKSGVPAMIGGVGKALTKGLTLPLAAIGGASVKTAANFEAGMSKVQAISGASAADMKRLSDMAKHMGATTKFSASQSAEALSYMGMAGWKTDQMIAGLPGVMNLAAASGEDLGMVSDIVTDSLTAFGLSANDTARFVDVLAATATNSNTNVAMMGETFKYAAPIAGALGYSVEDTALAVGLMANAGIKGSQAGTALRSALTRLSAPTAEVKKGMQMLGLNIKDLQGMTLDQKLQTLRHAFAGLDESQKVQAASLLFGKQAMSGMLAIINASESDYNNLKNAINNSSGAAKSMAEIMENNLKGSVTKLKSALEGAGIAIGEILAPKIKVAVDKITELVSAFTNLDPATQSTIVNIGLVAAAIGPALMIISKLMIAFSKVKTALSLASAAFSSFSAIAAGTATPITFMGQAVLAAKGGITAFAASLGLAAVPTAAFVAGVAAIGAAAVGLGVYLSQASIQTDVFGDKVSEGTQKAVGAFLDLNNQAKVALDQLAWSGQTVTAQMAQGIVSNFEQMNTQVVQKLQEQKEQAISSLQEMYTEMGTLDSQATQSKLARIGESYDQQIAIEQEGMARIREIMNTAREEKRSLTEQEAAEINQIREQMKNDGVRVLSETEQEYGIIMQRMKDQAGQLSAEQAAEVVRNSLKQKEQAIQAAEEEYNERIRIAQQLRAEGGAENEALADQIIKDAKRARDGAVQEAEDMHQKVVEEAQKQADEHVNKVDWETGEVKSRFRAMDDEVGSTIREMATKVKEKATEMANSIKEKFEEMKQKASEKLDQIKQAVQTKFGEAKQQASTAVNNIKSTVSTGFANVLSTVKEKVNQIPGAVRNGFTRAISAAKSACSQAVGVGRQLVNGFVNGVKAAAGRLASAARSVVAGAIRAAKGALRIHSPSRVFRDIGWYTVKGLAIGLEDNADMAAKAMGKVIDPLTGQEIDIGSNLDRINKQGNAAVDYVVSDKLGERKQSQTVILRLGNRDYKAFVDDITDAQGREIRLAEAYGI